MILPDVDGHVLSSDLRDDDVQPRAVGPTSVDERSAQSMRRPDVPHAFDEFGHLLGVRMSLGSTPRRPAAGDGHPVPAR